MKSTENHAIALDSIKDLPTLGMVVSTAYQPCGCSRKVPEALSLSTSHAAIFSHIHTKLTAFLRDSLSFFNKLLTALPG
jgi:hypothetical protein